jgi:uncharacterized cupredoxin-like copper-binding protein
MPMRADAFTVGRGPKWRARYEAAPRGVKRGAPRGVRGLGHDGPVLRTLCLSIAGIALVAAGCGGATPAGTPPITPGTGTSPRAVNIVARDYSFVPSVVDLVPGETVVVHVINGGLETHEAIAGDAASQQAWEDAEEATLGAPPGPTPAVAAPPGFDGIRAVVGSGQRSDVTWTVPADAASDAAGWFIGCHIPGHYAKGMVVPVRWVGTDGVPIGTAPSVPALAAPSTGG